MVIRASGLSLIVLVVLNAFGSMSCAEDSTKTPREDWAAVCLQAKGSFHPITPADVAKAKEQLSQAVERLGGRLDRDAEGGKAWKDYLHWDALTRELAAATPDLTKLDAAYARLNQQHEGLELVWFVDVRVSLRRYLNVVRAMDNPEIKPACERLLDALPGRLDAYAKSPTPSEAAMIGKAIAWLDDFGQAKDLIDTIRRRFCKPNLFAQVSRAVVSAGLAQTVDETEPVQDVILGTRVHGTGHTKGTLSVELFPSEEDAVVDTVLLSQTDSDTIGYNGPVRVYSSGVTTIGARKRFLITAEGITALPAVSNANTSTTFDGLCAVRGGQLVENIAWKRAYRDKCRAEAIAASHAEDRVNGRIDRKADETLVKANEAFVNKFRRPLVERKLLPDPFLFSTTVDALRVLGMEAGQRQLAASTAPPEIDASADIILRVHESMINNSAATMLADRNVSEELFLKTVGDILGKVPERLKPEEGKEPWGVHFAASEPFSLTFAENSFRVAIHAIRYTRGENDYPGMNVAATYKIETTDKGFRAVRQGELEVFPPGFVPGERRLSAREQTLRSLLQSRFGKIFDEQWVPAGMLELPGQWSKAGNPRLSQWSASKGWMTLAWTLPSSEKK